MLDALRAFLSNLFARCERNGLIARLPAFDTELASYPELRGFERAYPAVRAECEAVLRERAGLIDMERLGGQYTEGGHRRIGWKAFVLKAGNLVPEHCARCPITAAIIASVPGIQNAFFSVLEPGQHVAAHFGYYKGFVRYHLGVVIPDDNADQRCWLRINPHAEPGANTAQAIEAGDKHYWRNGQAVLFDDTYLHDACNQSDGVRVVLYLDVVRKLPPYLAWLNHAIIAVAYRVVPELRRMPQIAVARGDLPRRCRPAPPQVAAENSGTSMRETSG